MLKNSRRQATGALLLYFSVVAIAQSPEADMLAAHNAARAKVTVAALTWSPKLADVAKDWANKLLASGKFAHRDDDTYGENLFMMTGGSATPAQVVANWTSEAAGYDYTSNTCSKVCGHYTQVVWSTTKQVGCASARNATRQIWVCNYDPPGNFVGQRPY